MRIRVKEFDPSVYLDKGFSGRLSRALASPASVPMRCDASRFGTAPRSDDGQPGPRGD